MCELPVAVQMLELEGFESCGRRAYFEIKISKWCLCFVRRCERCHHRGHRTDECWNEEMHAVIGLPQITDRDEAFRFSVSNSTSLV